MPDEAGPGLELVEADGATFAERPTPWSEDIEIAALGAALIDTEARAELLQTTEPDDFHRAAHRHIRDAIARLHERGVPELDVTTVADELEADDKLEAAGGVQYLARLIDVPTAANLPHHVERLQELRALREVQNVAESLMWASAETGSGEVGAMLEDAQAKLEEIDTPDTLAGADLLNMADALEDSELLSPSERIAHAMVYRGQISFLYGDPKSGKTSTSIALAAAVSSGTRFMSRPTVQERVLYVAAEGDRGEIIRRLKAFVADPEYVDVVVPGESPVAELRTLMDARDYRLVILDTLERWMAPTDRDVWKTSEVNAVLTPTERIIRDSEAGLVAVHHANAEGKPINSTAYAAWADILRKVEDGEGPRERKVTGRARFEVPDLRFRLVEDDDGSRLVPSDPNREMEERILDYLEANPGASKRAIRDGVSGGRTEIDRRLENLIGDGFVDRDTSGRAHTHRIAQEGHGHATARVRHGQSHGSTGNGGGHRGDGGERVHKDSPRPPRSAEPVDEDGDGDKRDGQNDLAEIDSLPGMDP